MNTCPLCSGKLVLKISKAGEEIYCNGCSSIIASATLGFKLASSSVEECSEGGLPGYKGPGEGAKCYVYEPGNEAQQKRAEQKASQSAYMEQKRGFVTRALTDFSTGDSPSWVTGIDEADQILEPSKLGSIEDDPFSLGTITDKEGVEVQGPGDYMNAFSSKQASLHPVNDAQESLISRSALGTGYCDVCHEDHTPTEACPL